MFSITEAKIIMDAYRAEIDKLSEQEAKRFLLGTAVLISPLSDAQVMVMLASMKERLGLKKSTFDAYQFLKRAEKKSKALVKDHQNSN